MATSGQWQNTRTNTPIDLDISLLFFDFWLTFLKGLAQRSQGEIEAYPLNPTSSLTRQGPNGSMSHTGDEEKGYWGIPLPPPGCAGPKERENMNVVVRTITPTFLLIGAGFLSRKLQFLKSGDERVLSAYVYYFALPALFMIDMAETTYSKDTVKFMIAEILPVFVALVLLIALGLVLRFSKSTLYLLIVSTVFGSLAFFGIPFITFAFPTVEGEHVATLAAASIAPVSVAVAITTLELYRLRETTIWEGLKLVAKRLSRNPLIISILCGILLSVTGIVVPRPLSTPLHMLGGTTSAVAIFMLGVFLYGRRYTNLVDALKLSLLRIVFLPVIALLTIKLFDLPDMERATLVLMHGMPLAISMIILGERYDFHKETVASLILISSIGAGIYLNLWLWALGYL